METVERITSEAAIAEIELLRRYAADAAVKVDGVSMINAQTIGQSDTLVRLQRNAHALATLLSMAHDAAGYMRTELANIYQANEKVLADEAAKRAEIIERESKRAQSAKSNARRAERQEAVIND